MVPSLPLTWCGKLSKLYSLNRSLVFVHADHFQLWYSISLSSLDILPTIELTTCNCWEARLIPIKLKAWFQFNPGYLTHSTYVGTDKTGSGGGIHMPYQQSLDQPARCPPIRDSSDLWLLEKPRTPSGGQNKGDWLSPLCCHLLHSVKTQVIKVVSKSKFVPSFVFSTNIYLRVAMCHTTRLWFGDIGLSKMAWFLPSQS